VASSVLKDDAHCWCWELSTTSDAEEHLSASFTLASNPLLAAVHGAMYFPQLCFFNSSWKRFCVHCKHIIIVAFITVVILNSTAARLTLMLPAPVGSCSLKFRPGEWLFSLRFCVVRFGSSRKCRDITLK
jgi:hypothetical protein